MSIGWKEFARKEKGNGLTDDVAKSAKPKKLTRGKVHLLVTIQGQTDQYFRHWWHNGKPATPEYGLGFIKDTRCYAYYQIDKLNHLRAVGMFDDFCVKNDYNFPIPNRTIMFAMDVPVEPIDAIFMFMMDKSGELVEFRICHKPMLPVSWEPNTEYVAMTC